MKNLVAEIVLSPRRVRRLRAVPIESVDEILGRIPGSQHGNEVLAVQGARLVRSHFRVSGWGQVEGGWVHRSRPETIVTDEVRGVHRWASAAPVLAEETE